MSDTFIFIVGLIVATLSIVGILTQKNTIGEYEHFSGTDPRFKQTE